MAMRLVWACTTRPESYNEAGCNYVTKWRFRTGTKRGVDPWHTQDITFRAIENGFSLVRQTSNGLAIAVDYEGRVLASSDYFATGEQVMIASVPMRGVQTIYAVVGDLFAWLCLAGLLVLTAFALVQSRRQQTSRNTVAVPAPEPHLVG